MTEIIQRWIQDRLGVHINMSPENFAHSVKDGHLLASILKSYEIITQEQLDTVEKSDAPEICLTNFKEHIMIWLGAMDITLNNEELFEIVNSKGIAALNLFYRVYLELYGNTNLYFITEQRLKEKLRPKGRFVVQRVKESAVPPTGESAVVYDTPLREGMDIVHWQKDRMEMLHAKCKEAREEYLQYMRVNQIPKFRLRRMGGRSDSTQVDAVDNVDAASLDMTYEELVRQQDKAKRSQRFAPDPQHAQALLKKLRVKQREHSENLIFKTELHREIFTHFWEALKTQEDDRLNKNIMEVMTKQSLYEKQMHHKIGEVKMQKHVMLENKRNEALAISKQLETDFAHKLVIQGKELDALELTYYLEKERLNQLHAKLYERKNQMKKADNRKICVDAVEDLVKMAFNEAEYRRIYGVEPPRRVRDTWKKMFTGVIPFDSFIAPTEIILKKPAERPDELEEIIHLEIDRQDMIDKKDLEDYLEFEWPWSLGNTQVSQRGLLDMDAAMNIIGNIVHNLLAVKYPLAPLPPRPDFPNVAVSACINGIDINCLPVLRQILNLRHIEVVQMQDCIDCCIMAYYEETKGDDDDPRMSTDDAKKKKARKEAAKLIDEKKSRKGMKAKIVAATVMDEEITPENRIFADKIVQTPKHYPCEEIPLSHRAELGKVALEQLDLGEPLTNFILAAMFVEYLMSKPEIKGWVLINFPKTYEEAAVLEERLTGLPVPDLEGEQVDGYQSLMELTALEVRPSKQEVNELADCRRSRMLPEPVPKTQPDFYDTALTAYIKVVKKNADGNKPSQSRMCLEELDDDSDPLDKFYSDLGCNYHFYYNRLDFNSVKSLAKLVVGDYSLPRKTSVEIFGEAINTINTDREHTAVESVMATKKGQKKQKPKEKKDKRRKSETMTKETSDKKTKSTKSAKSLVTAGKGKGKGKDKKPKTAEPPEAVIDHEDKYTQIPEEEEEFVEEEELEIVSMVSPGGKDWPYVDLPFPETLQVAMATLWENAEEVYLVDMEQVFFMKRLVLNAFMPFVDSVKQHMAEYLQKPDEKQKYLRDFQKSFNEFEDDFRYDPDFKAEMHCRINEMREKLVEISDWKMIAADHERVFIIEKNWTSKQLIEFVNNYISAFQLELDRFVDTMSLVTDYYTALVTKMPSNMLLQKEVLPKMESDHAYTIKAINGLLQNVDDAEEEVLHEFVEMIVEKCLYVVESAQHPIKLGIKKIKEILEDAHKAKDKIKEKTKQDKARKDRDSTHEPSKILALIECELADDILACSSKVMHEWNCAIRGEISRVQIRFNMLKYELFRNLDEVLATVRKVFHDIYEEIRVSYRKELASIENVCKVLSLAVEKELKIQEELILDRIDFYVDPEVMLFPDALPPVKPLEESYRTGVFTIDQLDKLVDIFMDLSPSGYMPERSFIYLFEDLIVSKDEPILLPELWRKVQPRHVDKISKCLFDELEYVQWKDFIVHNLMVPCPTQQEILEVRQAFRDHDPDCTELVTDYQFYAVKFWFEDHVEDKLRLKLMKRLLFKMYRVKEDAMNYTAFLLDFCKDSSPVAGIAKALTVCMGEPVCWEKETGDHFVEMARRKRRYEEMRAQRKEELKGGQEVVEHIAGELVEEVMETCELREEQGEELEQCEVVTPENQDLSSIFDENITVELEPVADLAYFLPLEVLVTVITTCLPWHARVQNIEDKSFIEYTEDIYAKCKHRKFDYKVLSHEFLNHPLFVEQLNKTNKFSTKNPVEIVDEVLTGKVEERSRKSKRR